MTILENTITVTKSLLIEEDSVWVQSPLSHINFSHVEWNTVLSTHVTQWESIVKLYSENLLVTLRKKYIQVTGIIQIV